LIRPLCVILVLGNAHVQDQQRAGRTIRFGLGELVLGRLRDGGRAWHVPGHSRV